MPASRLLAPPSLKCLLWLAVAVRSKAVRDCNHQLQSGRGDVMAEVCACFVSVVGRLTSFPIACLRSNGVRCSRRGVQVMPREEAIGYWEKVNKEKVSPCAALRWVELGSS